MTVELNLPADVKTTWTAVCTVDDLPRERGAAALVGRTQVALFRTFDDTVYAVQQLDPFSGANVMSRGIVGTRGGVPTVASPMYKQVFDLRTGECLDAVGKEPQRLRTFAVQVVDGVVSVGPGPAGSPSELPVDGPVPDPVDGPVPDPVDDPVAGAG